MEGPLSMSEADLAALEERDRKLVAHGRRILAHLSNCEHSDLETLNGFKDLLAYIGIRDEVFEPHEPITQLQAEMACHHEE